DEEPWFLGELHQRRRAHRTAGLRARHRRHSVRHGGRGIHRLGLASALPRLHRPSHRRNHRALRSRRVPRIPPCERPLTQDRNSHYRHHPSAADHPPALHRRRSLRVHVPGPAHHVLGGLRSADRRRTADNPQRIVLLLVLCDLRHHPLVPPLRCSRSTTTRHRRGRVHRCLGIRSLPPHRDEVRPHHHHRHGRRPGHHPSD